MDMDRFRRTLSHQISFMGKWGNGTNPERKVTGKVNKGFIYLTEQKLPGAFIINLT